MKKAASGGVLAGAILVTHAKRLFLAFHEKRGKPFTRGSCVLAFATSLAALATALRAIFSSKAGVLFTLTRLSACLAPTATTRVSRAPCILVIQKLLGRVALGANKLLRSALTSLTS